MYFCYRMVHKRDPTPANDTKFEVMQTPRHLDRADRNGMHSMPSETNRTTKCMEGQHQTAARNDPKGIAPNMYPRNSCAHRIFRPHFHVRGHLAEVGRHKRPDGRSKKCNGGCIRSADGKGDDAPLRRLSSSARSFR